MVASGFAATLIQVTGPSASLVDRLREPLQRALGDRRGLYSVRVDSVGRMGEVLVGISGSRGRVPLLFGEEDLEPGHVFQVVRDTVTRLEF